MKIKCRVCDANKPKRKVIKRMPVVENELPEKFREYREFICMNVIKELRKDKKWHDAVCENRTLILRNRLKNE